MSVAITSNTVTAWHSSKKSDGNYGSDEYGAAISTPIDPNATAEQRMAHGDMLRLECQSIVESAMNGGTAPAAAVPQAAPAVAPAVAQPAAQPAAAPTGVPAPVANTFPGAAVVVPETPEEYTGDIKNWAPERVAYLLEINDTETLNRDFFDNRAKKATGAYSPKAPDFKYKNNSELVVWPPRNN